MDHKGRCVCGQVTRFKCGGISIGLSWAHVLGDAFSATAFMNSLFSLIFGDTAVNSAIPPTPDGIETTSPPKIQPSAVAKPPLSVRRVEPVGDHWIPTNNCKMETFSFSLNATQLAKLQTQMPKKTSAFEAVSATLWQSIAKLRKGSEPTTVTLCKLDPTKQQGKILGNSQTISTVKAGVAVSDADPRELASLLLGGGALGGEGDAIGEAVEKDDGVSDFVVYGANLTFVKWDEADLYGDASGEFERPKFVYHTVQGVGEGGAVVVLPEAEEGGGRLVTVTLPENEVVGLRAELTAKGIFLEKQKERVE